MPTSPAPAWEGLLETLMLMGWDEINPPGFVLLLPIIWETKEPTGGVRGWGVPGGLVTLSPGCPLLSARFVCSLREDESCRGGWMKNEPRDDATPHAAASTGMRLCELQAVTL